MARHKGEEAIKLFLAEGGFLFAASTFSKHAKQMRKMFFNFVISGVHQKSVPSVCSEGAQSFCHPRGRHGCLPSLLASFLPLVRHHEDKSGGV